MKAPCDKPCASCPWLRANQRPEAVLRSPVDGDGIHWFSVENLTRRWREIARIGVMLPCHKTDANAGFYGGRFTQAGKERICVGLSILARREMTALMNSGQEFSAYKRIKGKRFSPVALAVWASRLYYGGAVHELAGRSFTMPDRVEDDPLVGVPWKDAVHDEA